MTIRWVDPRDYYEKQNLAGALRDAHEVIRGIHERLFDPLMRQEEVQIAFEVLCDLREGSTRQAFGGVIALEPRYRRPEFWERDRPTANALRYVCWLTTAAEVAHRDCRYAQAVVYTTSAFNLLAEAAGGFEQLIRLVASSKRNPLAEAAVAVNAIRVSALRRASYSQAAKDWFRSITADILPAYLASGCVYPRSHAFGTQGLFDQAELGIPVHCDDLYDLSTFTRGTTARALATAPMVEMEHWRALGDVDAAKREATRARAALEDFGLFRHVEMAERFGYFDFAQA